jgi:hypothetical protein
MKTAAATAIAAGDGPGSAAVDDGRGLQQQVAAPVAIAAGDDSGAAAVVIAAGDGRGLQQ